MEPVRTIYTEDWVRARSEVDRLAVRESGEPFSRALSQLETAWEHARPLERWCERGEVDDVGEAEDALRWHVEYEVADLFRWIAGETLRCIPRPGTTQAASVDDLETEVEALRRSVRILLLAVQGQAVPATLRQLAREHAAHLVPWTIAFGQTVTAIRRYLDGSGRHAEDD